MSSPPKTILLVDDEGSVREVMKMALEAWGYGVWVAEDGEEALKMMRNNGPRVVLSDVIMPKMDGLSLLRRLKRWDPDIAVILFTAHPSISGAVSAMKEGAADVLTKPIDFKRLRYELEQLMGGSGHSSGDSSPSNSNPPFPGPPPGTPRLQRKRDLRPQHKPT
jgi:DNA-binding NtrC family response regulator